MPKYQNLLKYIYSKISGQGLGSSGTPKGGLVPRRSKSSADKCPRTVQSRLPPVQGQLDVQRCPKPPVQGQLDVQKLPETVSPELTSAQSAEPPFLLAGAVLSRVRRLCGKTENRLKSTNNYFEETIGTSGVQKLDFFAGAGPTCRSKVPKTVGPGPIWLAKVPKTAGPGPACRWKVHKTAGPGAT